MTAERCTNPTCPEHWPPTAAQDALAAVLLPVLRQHHAGRMNTGDPWDEDPYQDAHKPGWWDDDAAALADAVLEHLTSAGWAPPPAGEHAPAPDGWGAALARARFIPYPEIGLIEAMAKSPAQPGDPANLEDLVDNCPHEWDDVMITTTLFDGTVTNRTEGAYRVCTECGTIAPPAEPS